MIIYPDKPWYDGQEFEHTTSEGQKVVGTYNEANNTWVFRDFRLASDLVYTDTVYTVNMKPSSQAVANVAATFDDTKDLPSPGQFTTQQDVNWYLYDLINTTGGGSNVWVGVNPPPTNPDGTPLFEFWWNPNEELLYFWSFISDDWELTGLMEFDRPPIISISPPNTHPKFPGEPLEKGDFWIDPNNIMHYWTGSEWQEVLDSEHYTNDGHYVLKTGDTMTGTLEIANEGDATNLDFDPNKANLTFTTTKTDGSDSSSVSIHQNGFNSSLSITGGLVADGNYYTETGRYYGSDPNGQYFAARAPFLQLEKTEGTLEWYDSTRFQWNALGGSLRWGGDARLEWNASNVEIPKPVEDDTNADGFIIRGTTASGYETDDPLDENGKLLSAYHNADTADAVNYEGRILSESNLVNKGYVDAKDEQLRQDIIELEEEIDAIAPSVEYGTWVWKNPSALGRPPAEGEFYLLDDVFATTEEYGNTKHIVIHDDEYGGTGNHSWLEADPGKLIQLYDAADPDFLLGEITNTDIRSGHVIITVDRIQTNGTPADTVDSETGEFLTRINIFEKPSGGDASGFVLKTGDTMTGDLTIDRSTGTANTAASLILKGERPNTTNSAATIKFENAKNSSNPGYLTYKSFGSFYWFTFDQDVDLSGHGLHSVARLRLKSGGYIGAGDDERIKIRSGGGNDNQAGTEIQRFGESKRTFAIRGKIKDATSESDIFWAYANTGKTGDAINYRGLVTHDYHITNRGYVRSNYVKGNYTITKSNGNYYIQ